MSVCFLDSLEKYQGKNEWKQRHVNSSTTGVLVGLLSLEGYSRNLLKCAQRLRVACKGSCAIGQASIRLRFNPGSSKSDQSTNIQLSAYTSK